MADLFLSDNIIDTCFTTNTTYNSVSSDKVYYIDTLYGKYLLDSIGQPFRIISNGLDGKLTLSNYNTSLIPTPGNSILLTNGTSDFDNYMIQEVIDVYSNSLISKNIQVIDSKTRFPFNLTNYDSTVVISKYLSDQENFTFFPTVSYSKNSDLIGLDSTIFTSSQIVWDIVYENVSVPLYQLPSTKWSIKGVVDFNNEMSAVEDSNIIPLQYSGNLSVLNGIGGVFNLEIPQQWNDPTSNTIRTSLLIPGVYMIEFRFVQNIVPFSVFRITTKLNVIESQQPI